MARSGSEAAAVVSDDERRPAPAPVAQDSPYERAKAYSEANRGVAQDSPDPLREAAQAVVEAWARVSYVVYKDGEYDEDEMLARGLTLDAPVDNLRAAALRSVSADSTAGLDVERLAQAITAHRAGGGHECHGHCAAAIAREYAALSDTSGDTA